MQVLICQIGFRKAMSTMEGIFSFRLLRQLARETYTTFHLLFSDFEAAYDHIPMAILWKSILKCLPTKIDKTMFMIMQSMYKHTKCFIKTIQETLMTENGLILGNSVSCICFNIYLETIIRLFLRHAQDKKVHFPNI